MMKRALSILAIGSTVALACTAGNASASPVENVTPDVIFGDGNANGSFTIDRGSGVELGLRGKLRFNDNNQPENTFNYDGVDTYTFSAGTPPTGFSFDSNSPTTPIWNFEWSINSDFNGNANELDAYTYKLSLDAEPGAGTLLNTFDPINDFSVADHAFGDNNTGNGDGEVASDAIHYTNLIANNNVAQNSWSYEFFNDSGQLVNFDPNIVGEYTITLSAIDNNDDQVASTSININVVPSPTAALAGLGLLGGLAMKRRRRA